MAIVAPVITGYFDLGAGDDTLFTIEHPTLGLLDTGGVLAGPGFGGTPTDISGYGFDIGIARGRSVETDEIRAGTCRTGLHNHLRTFDGSYTSGAFAGNVVPGRRFEVSVYGVTIFTGVTDDWESSFDPVYSQAGVLAVDALGQLARIEFDEWTTTSQLPGARIQAVLDRPEVAMDVGVDLDDGVETLQADLATWGSNVLNYLQLVALTDQGRLFASRTGVVTFRDRLSLAGGTPSLTFADDGSGFGFQGVTKRNAAEQLYTIVSVDREGGTAQSASNADAIESFGRRRLSLSGLLLSSDARSLELAEWLVGIYSQANDRISGLSIIVSAVESEADQATIAATDIGDVVQVVWTPQGIGNQLDLTMVVEGVSHSFDRSGLHTMTLSLSELAQASPFIIEDDVLGLLDTGGVLSF